MPANNCQAIANLSPRIWSAHVDVVGYYFPYHPPALQQAVALTGLEIVVYCVWPTQTMPDRWLVK